MENKNTTGNGSDRRTFSVRVGAIIYLILAKRIQAKNPLSRGFLYNVNTY